MDSSQLSRTILAKEYTLQDILGNKKYSVDYFQREYKWGKENIDQLINDLTGAFMDNYRPGHKTSDVTDNVTDSSINVTDTQSRILDILQQMPDVSQSRLAEMVGIHRVNVNRNIRQLVDRSILTRVGSDRKGYWRINRKPKS